jgi:hypothetical protein
MNGNPEWRRTMAEIYGAPMRRSEILRRVGDISQVCDARRMQYTEGKADGVQSVAIKTGSGLEFTVLPSRGLDIPHASFRGIPLCWVSPSGIASPAFFRAEGYEWLRNFFGGLLTTCGMTYNSHPCEDEGEQLGLHGRVSNIPAEDVNVMKEWRGDDYFMEISGRIRETKTFGDNLVMNRRISTSLGARSIHIHDRIENTGFHPSPLMMLYHINIGWPVVSEHARLVAPSEGMVPGDDRARNESDQWTSFLTPQPDYEERVYFHRMRPDGEGNVLAGIVNDHLNLGVYLRYPLREFPWLVEWKMMGEGVYAVGVEPGNITGNRAQMRKEGTLEFIRPGAERSFSLEIGVLDGEAEIARFENTVRGIPA